MAAMRFPCRLEPGLGRFRPMDGLEEIAQSVRLILATRRGERPLRPRFGARLDQFAFEGMDTTTRTLIRQEVVAVLQAWEPRIWNIRVEFEDGPEAGLLVVRVAYQVRRTGAAGGQEFILPAH